MEALLQVTTGQRAGEEVSVRPGEVLSIGRSAESDLQLLDLGVSRFHCVLEDQADGLTVTDLNSSNGTFVNGERVKRQVLSRGDEVALGAVTLVVAELPERRRAGAGDLFTGRGGADVRVVKAIEPDATALFARASGPDEPADERRVQRDLAALYKIGNEIHAQMSLRRLLAVVMDVVFEVIAAERGFLLLADKTTGDVRPQVVRARPGSGADGELPVSRPLVQECMEQGVAILCPDLMAEERYSDGDALLLDHIRSVLCAPLSVGDRVAGAIYLDTASDVASFTEHDLDLLTAIGRQAGVALHRAQLIEELERLFVGMVEALVATVEAKDIYTYGHSARVSKLSRQMAERMGFSEEQQEEIKVAGLLHDIGKIGIPEAILSKPGRLTDEEWEYIRSHPQIGESIIAQMGSERLAAIRLMVRHHHERLDGSGYPDGLSGDAIPLGARLLAVADAYDAMTSNRPYRTPFSSQAAIEELRSNAGTQFNADAVNALIDVRAERVPAAAGLAAKVEPEST